MTYDLTELSKFSSQIKIKLIFAQFWNNSNWKLSQCLTIKYLTIKLCAMDDTRIKKSSVYSSMWIFEKIFTGVKWKGNCLYLCVDKEAKRELCGSENESKVIKKV